MVVLQLIATRVAAITGNGLTENMPSSYVRRLFALALARFLLANTFNLVADTLAMGEAARLMFHGPVGLFALVFAIVLHASKCRKLAKSKVSQASNGDAISAPSSPPLGSAIR
ncbi:hypothetical protein LMG27952_07657 [Paraburkholderia hiiakae]|uniref:Uncharacterized protein n=1 Tax=Paraburkholderia hiiakae TaxID=1081782 RepID=A0ABM8PBK4_9BURK|nr:divalent metal cation transporter [Paraburkholderia hiiakae]CAD6562019.1 hypothetical protein LMG27952_07657 [Paraburkholderia hiiakae]